MKNSPTTYEIFVSAETLPSIPTEGDFRHYRDPRTSRTFADCMFTAKWIARRLRWELTLTRAVVNVVKSDRPAHIIGQAIATPKSCRYYTNREECNP